VEASRNIFRQSSDADNIRLRADLETLVSYFPAQQAFLPQDIVYSLLAISSDRPKSPSDRKAPVFQVNYEKSPRLVFKEFVEYCVQQSKSLDIICRHWAPKPNITKASLDPDFDRQRPSWISDVSGLAFGIRGTNQYGRNNGDSLVGTPDRRYYNASKGTLGMAIFGESQNEYASTALVQSSSVVRPLLDNLDGSMTVSGFKLGKIEQLGPRSNEGIILQEWIEMAGWTNEDVSVPAYFWRTLVADRGPDGVPPPTWYHRACAYCLDQTGGGDVSIAQLSVRSCPSMAINFLTRVRNVIWNRKFLRTSTEDGEGLYGLAPSKAEIGDTICVLYGCSVPVVLRRHPKNKLAWELVGECFVYGMMDGEAMESEMSGHPQEFELR
jgi:hypothetical protein